ncbi:MAG: hypothetical protein V3T17_11240 [Pseudomonadales bacterium]
MGGNIPEIREKVQEAFNTISKEFGVNAIRCDISQLTFSPEIERVMLNRLQVGAILETKTLLLKQLPSKIKPIIDEIVSCDGMALGKVEKMRLINNILIILCNEPTPGMRVNLDTIEPVNFSSLSLPGDLSA